MEELNKRSQKYKADLLALKSREFLRFCLFTLVVVPLKPFFMAGLILICNIDGSGISLYILAAVFLICSILSIVRLIRFGKINRAHKRQGLPSLPIPTLASCAFALFFVLTIATTIDACVWTSTKDLGVKPKEISKIILEKTYGIKI